jgi:hypothetical protein
VHGRAKGFQILLDKCFEGIKVTQSRIILELVGISPLDRGVTSNIVILAEFLGFFLGAVDVAHYGCLGLIEFAHEFVPLRLYFLTGGCASERRNQEKGASGQP